MKTRGSKSCAHYLSLPINHILCRARRQGRNTFQTFSYFLWVFCDSILSWLELGGSRSVPENQDWQSRLTIYLLGGPAVYFESRFEFLSRSWFGFVVTKHEPKQIIFKAAGDHSYCEIVTVISSKKLVSVLWKLPPEFLYNLISPQPRCFLAVVHQNIQSRRGRFTLIVIQNLGQFSNLCWFQNPEWHQCSSWGPNLHLTPYWGTLLSTRSTYLDVELPTLQCTSTYLLVP